MKLTGIILCAFLYISIVFGNENERQIVINLIHLPPSCKACFTTLHDFFVRSDTYSSAKIRVLSVTEPDFSVEQYKKSLMSDRVEIVFIQDTDSLYRYILQNCSNSYNFNMGHTPYVYVRTSKDSYEGICFSYNNLFINMYQLQPEFIDYILSIIQK